MRKLLYSTIMVFLLAVLMAGCRTVKYVSVPEYHYETVYNTDTFIQKDSVFCHDSVFMFRNGDTITISKVKTVYKDRWREIIKIDSFIKTDSVRVPYPVEKNLTKWQKLKMDFGGMAFGGFLFCLILSIGLLVYKKKRLLDS